jgi:hypothetical protein
VPEPAWLITAVHDAQKGLGGCNVIKSYALRSQLLPEHRQSVILMTQRWHPQIDRGSPEPWRRAVLQLRSSRDLPRISLRSAQQTLPRWITSRPRQPAAAGVIEDGNGRSAIRDHNVPIG